MFRQYDLDIEVFRSNKISVEQAEDFNPDYILISPGPKDPADSGVSMPVIKAFYKHIPVLGVCLGMQCINEVFGGRTVPAPIPMHGKTSLVSHENYGIFKSVPSPFTAARYHSLSVKPGDQNTLLMTACSQDGVIMGMSHRKYPLHGVQFHPESFLTESGFTILENFLNLGPLKNV